MKEQVTASYTHCRRIARRSASSFYYSFLLLPKPKRHAMCALYAFLRRSDDLGDSAAPLDERRKSLLDWRRALVACQRGMYADPILPALADTIRTFDIPTEYLHAVIDGIESDLEPLEYETFVQLEQYCFRVASVVGLACLRIWGAIDPPAERPARQCGIAFQLTNILRDLKEDAARDRIYLPREDLSRFGYSAANLRAGVRDERFRRLMRFQIERAETFYAEAEQLEPWLAPDSQRVFGSMMSVYRALLAEIKRLDGDVLTSRARLSRWRKMRIATHWFFRSPLEPAASVAP